ncbi:hypothetical protein WKI13_04715 [Teredinibacter turnerae]|uniref:hypothetical protein n=1 Tax=Teredinibacter turnerae TaxID=2426 RepID=UPI001E564CD6|nr:hypothetical protein [Teredinibacter turnerae]
MTKSRQTQVCLDETPFYHCYVRCVRLAYLWGEDFSTGDSYDHRKQWIVSRLRFLSYVYAIDICAYAEMSNHYHVVLQFRCRGSARVHSDIPDLLTKCHKALSAVGIYYVRSPERGVAWHRQNHRSVFFKVAIARIFMVKIR